MRKIIFSIISIASIAAAIYFSFVSNPNYGMTGIWLTFSLFSFAFGWPEIAESISFLGNNIKLREVKSAINELKQLAEVNSKIILELIQCSNRFGGFKEDERISTYNTIEKMLTNLNFTQDEIRHIQSPWHYWIERDYVDAIIISNNATHPEIPKEKHNEWIKKRGELKKIIHSITPDELCKIFQDFDAYTSKVKEAINDFEYYKKHKKHRDLDKWENRDKWFK